MANESERIARTNYETYRIHCLEESPYWTPLWHPAWDELSETSRASWIAVAEKLKAPPEPPAIKPFFSKFTLLKTASTK